MPSPRLIPQQSKVRDSYTNSHLSNAHKCIRQAMYVCIQAESALTHVYLFERLSHAHARNASFDVEEAESKPNERKKAAVTMSQARFV